MNWTEFAQYYFGERFSGVRFTSEKLQNYHPLASPLCQWIYYSFTNDIEISNQDISCPGARRAINNGVTDQELINTIAGNSGIEIQYVEKALKETPQLDINISGLILGKSQDDPQIIVGYTEPANVLSLIRKLEENCTQSPDMSKYTMMSVCGNVIAKSYMKDNIAISFGCPESRKNGGIRPDEVAVGIPIDLVKKLQ